LFISHGQLLSRARSFSNTIPTLTRRLAATADAVAILPGSPREPQEIITFHVVLDITDKAEIPAEFPDLSDGIYPQMSAIEQLMYASTPSTNSLVLFVWGENRILPVQVIEMQIVEQMFNPTLTPTLAEIAVTLRVLKHADLADRDWALRFWQDQVAKMQQFAASASHGSLNQFGLNGL
jgi:hypothetical protein